MSRPRGLAGVGLRTWWVLGLAMLVVWVMVWLLYWFIWG